MPIVIRSPYPNTAHPWFKGNLHTHTTGSDGSRDPQTIVGEYAARGYDFLMLSDHDRFTDPAPLDPRGIVLIPGAEISAGGPHLLHVGLKAMVPPDPNRQAAVDAINAQGAFAILCHPNWEASFNHCPHEKLEAWQGYAGLEIYNGVVADLEGSALATDRWDRLLAKGRRVWGYAHDDSHGAQHVGRAWNVVQCAERRADLILEALRTGSFYASTGVTIQRVEFADRTLYVHAPDAHRVIVYGDAQKRLAVYDCSEATFVVPEDIQATYLRFECWGCGERMAWSQPFFIERT